MSPQTLVTGYLKKSLRTDAKVAAVILRACPEFAGDQEVGQWLRRMGAGTVRPASVLAMLEAAKVNGSRPVSDLRVWQRHALAAELEKFASELGLGA